MLDPKEQILAHCEMLHSLAAGINGVLVVSVFYANPLGDTDRPGTISHHAVGDAERMADAIADHLGTPNANVFVGLQVMRKNLQRGSRGSESDVVAILGLVADMDADTGKAGGVLPMAPSYSLETSPGNEQPVWLFERPLTVAEAKPLAATLRRATGSDAGTVDVTHVWRVPGTLNWPNKKKIARGRSTEPCDVTVKQEWAGDLIAVEDFRVALAPFQQFSSETVKTVETGEIPPSVDTSPELQEMLAGDGQPDRSAHAARVVEAIAFRGHSLEEAVSLVVNCQGGWAERYRDSAHRQKDVERLWAKFAKPDDMVAAGKEIADSFLASALTREPASRPPEEAAPLIKATPFEWVDSTTLPRREYINGTHLIRKYVSVTVAPGGLGKSSLIIAEALAMSTGRPLFGGGIEPRRRVWLWNGEDPRDELSKRVMAACNHYNISKQQLDGYLFVDTGREAEIVVAVEERDGVKIVRPVVDAVVEAIKKNNIDVMVVDPFVSVHSINENDNGAIDKVAKLWGRIADECNVAIEVVHHVRKVSDREVSVEDSRGAGSLIAASRSARVLNRMTKEQAHDAGVSEDERFQIFSVSVGKANLAPMSAHFDWRRLVSVPLNNHGDSISEPGNHAGVVTEWHWPSKEEAADGVTADQLAIVKARLASGNHRKDAQAKDWAGVMVGEVIGSTDKGAIKRMLASWIDAGELAIEERRDGKGVLRDFVGVGDA